MPNLYESNDFNILTVYQKELVHNYDDGTSESSTGYLLKIQRFPLDTYPDLTDVFIFSNEIPLNATKNEFLAAAPSIVTQKLLEFDATFTGETVDLHSTSDLTQKFTE